MHVVTSHPLLKAYKSAFPGTAYCSMCTELLKMQSTSKLHAAKAPDGGNLVSMMMVLLSCRVLADPKCRQMRNYMVHAADPTDKQASMAITALMSLSITQIVDGD